MAMVIEEDCKKGRKRDDTTGMREGKENEKVEDKASSQESGVELW